MPQQSKIESIPSQYPGSYDNAQVKAQPNDPEKVKRDAEKRLRELEKNRQQNPSFGI